MKKNLLLPVLVLAVVFISGCVDQPTVEGLPYNDDIITIEEYYVSDKTPYEGSIVIIELLVQNNGEEPVPRVKVGFDVPRFIIKDLDCEDSKAPVDTDNDGTDDACVFREGTVFGEIEPFDTRRVILTLQAQKQGILRPVASTITYSVEYDYHGFREMNIPIIDGDTLKKPLSKYSQSTPTYGPIQLTFEPPVRGERVEDDKTIKEYWGVRDSPFKVEMEFTHVGSSSVGMIETPKIKAGKVKLDLRGSLKIAVVAGVELPCYFADNEGYLFSNKNITVPDELICNFQSVPFSDENYNGTEERATIWADFDYTYSYTNSQDFEIQPLP